jgi:hypothetical protein
MKKFVRCLIPLLALVLLVGCFPERGNPTFNSTVPGYWDEGILQTKPTTPSSTGDSFIDIPTVPDGYEPPTRPPTAMTTRPSRPTVSTTTRPAMPPTTQPEDVGGKLTYTKYGRFTGLYPEDGKDQYVEGVAALYVTNVSDEYLEYANISFKLDETDATFVVTGLLPGASVWVLEKNRLTIAADATVTHMTDETAFREDNRDESDNVYVQLNAGYMNVTNNTGKDLKSVYVYYKQTFSDGSFLGGITYRVLVGDMTDGQTVQSTAGHCSPGKCQVVRIDWA